MVPTPRALATAVPRSTIVPQAVVVPDCPAHSEAESDAASLIRLLPSAEPQAVQFAVDSLRELRQEVLPLLVCHLSDTTPLKVRRIFWLNHSSRAELIAHHAPRTVADVVGVVLGSPPGQDVGCWPSGERGSAVGGCARAWTQYLTTSPEAR